jgi:hypothetical protein
MRFAGTSRRAQPDRLFGLRERKEEIDYGGKLLLSKDYSLTRICFETSIQNLTNLYKFFKHFTRQPRMGQPPYFCQERKFLSGCP